MVNFKNAVIIMTSNIGSATILESMERDPESMKDKVTQQVGVRWWGGGAFGWWVGVGEGGT